MGGHHRQRQRRLHLRRIREPRGRMPDADRLGVPPDARARRSARAARREAWTAAPRALNAITEPSPPTPSYDRDGSGANGPQRAAHQRSDPANWSSDCSRARRTEPRTWDWILSGLRVPTTRIEPGTACGHRGRGVRQARRVLVALGLFGRTRTDRAAATRGERRMTKAPLRARNCDRKLARPIVLDDGTKLVTLARRRASVRQRFATVKRWRLLELAIERLIAAAESGKRDAVKIATDAIEGVLRARHPLCLSAASHQLPWNRKSWPRPSHERHDAARVRRP